MLKNARTFLWILVLAMISVILALGWPSSSAAIASDQAEVVKLRMAQAMRKRGLDLSIHVTGQSAIARWVESTDRLATHDNLDGALSLDGGESTTDLGARSYLHENRCLVLLPASMLHRSNVMQEFARTLGSEALVWRFVMTHEAAHCLHNPAQQYKHAADPGNRGQLSAELLDAQYLTEAFADVYAFLDMYQQDPRILMPLAMSLRSLRSNSNTAWEWRTWMAIEYAAGALQDAPLMNSGGHDLPDAAGGSGEVNAQGSLSVDDLAWQSALHGLSMMRPTSNLLMTRALN